MKRIIYIIVLFFALASIVNSVSAIYQLFHKRDLLIAAQQALKKQKKQHSELQDRLKTVSSQAFIEQEARNKLFFLKPGENTIFIAKDLIATKSAIIQKSPTKTNWQQWIEIFL